MSDTTLAYEPQTVGDAVRQTLAALGITQTELAETTGISAKHINQVITGAISISPEVAHKIGRATGIPGVVWRTIDAIRRDWEFATAPPEDAAPPVALVKPKLREELASTRTRVRTLERHLARVMALADETRGERDTLARLLGGSTERVEQLTAENAQLAEARDFFRDALAEEAKKRTATL